MVVCPQFTGVISFKEFQNFIERSEQKQEEQESEKIEEESLIN